MSNGYVKIFRKVLDNPNASNHLFLAVWSYLLLKASHKPYVMRIAGEDRTLCPGDLVCSCRKVAEFFDINKDTVNNIFNTMEKDSMIRRKMYARKTVISVLNWSSYQENPDASRDTSPDALPDTSPDTNKKKEERRYIDDDVNNRNSETKIASSEESETDKVINRNAREVLNKFNTIAGKRFRGAKNLESIRARLREGHSMEDMILVIEHKTEELKGTTNEPKWLNPTCLFRPSNFDRNLDRAVNKDEYAKREKMAEYRRMQIENPARAEELRRQMIEERKRNELIQS